MHPNSVTTSERISSYPKLVQFLVEPFLDTPESLKVDVEQLKGDQRVWIRLAFEDKDKGRVFGRGGRNIQAIRTILETTAKEANQSLYLDVYSEEEKSSRRERSSSGRGSNASGGQRSPRRTPKPSPKPRSK
jgi:predicted RNA-binding protein YlqC (UPF0109 family)